MPIQIARARLLASSSHGFNLHFNNFTRSIEHPRAIRNYRLEVERKFTATPLSLSYLRSSNQTMHFKSSKSLGRKITHDIYLDTQGRLFGLGVYIRKRNGKWEAKVRTGGDFINSAFSEVEGYDAVRDIVGEKLELEGGKWGVEEVISTCAEFVTERESWFLDGKFRVDADKTDFGHCVGEVELLRDIEFEGKLSERERMVEEERVRRAMDGEIEEFMGLYPEAFPVGKPVGKLTAYFQLLGKI